MANSPTMVLPDPVGAATRTPRPSSISWHDRIWKSSSSKPHSPANSRSIGCLLPRMKAA